MADSASVLPRIAKADLVRFIAAAYRAVGIPAAEAQKAAELMAASDVSGADGHGVFRLPQYIRRIKAGGLNIAPDIRVIRGGKVIAETTPPQTTLLGKDVTFTGSAGSPDRPSRSPDPASGR